MFDSFDYTAGGGERQRGNSPLLASRIETAAQRGITVRRGPTFSKIFRWRLPSPLHPTPASVELAGSFTNWPCLALRLDPVTDTWQLALENIPGNCTHRYMLLVDGNPAHDANCDGLAAPENLEENQHQLMTARGPRVFLLFAQTK